MSFFNLFFKHKTLSIAILAVLGVIFLFPILIPFIIFLVAYTEYKANKRKKQPWNF